MEVASRTIYASCRTSETMLADLKFSELEELFYHCGIWVVNWRRFAVIECFYSRLYPLCICTCCCDCILTVNNSWSCSLPWRSTAPSSDDVNNEQLHCFSSSWKSALTVYCSDTQHSAAGGPQQPCASKECHPRRTINPKNQTRICKLWSRRIACQIAETV